MSEDLVAFDVPSFKALKRDHERLQHEVFKLREHLGAIHRGQFGMPGVQVEIAKAAGTISPGASGNFHPWRYDFNSGDYVATTQDEDAKDWLSSGFASGDKAVLVRLNQSRQRVAIKTTGPTGAGFAYIIPTITATTIPGTTPDWIPLDYYGVNGVFGVVAQDTTHGNFFKATVAGTYWAELNIEFTGRAGPADASIIDFDAGTGDSSLDYGGLRYTIPIPVMIQAFITKNGTTVAARQDTVWGNTSGTPTPQDLYSTLHFHIPIFCAANDLIEAKWVRNLGTSAGSFNTDFSVVYGGPEQI